MSTPAPPTIATTGTSISEYIVSGFHYFGGISPPPSPPPPSPSPSTPETTTTTTINSNEKAKTTTTTTTTATTTATITTIVNESNDNRIDCGDDDDNATNKAISSNNYSKVELDKLVGMIHSSRCRKGDSCPYLGEKCKVMQQTYVHSKNCKVKNCKEPYCSRNLLRHFAECQNLDCRSCMHVRNMCIQSPMKKRGVCIETRK